MNARLLLAGFVMALISAPAMSMDAKTCEAQSAKMPATERSAFMKKCLADLSSPSNVKERQQQEKRARCEQNAKNQKLQGGAQANFVSSCMNKNEAAEAAKAAPVQTAASAEPTARPRKAAANSKPPVSCAKQAKQKGLKGEERKQFMKECSAS